MVLFKVFNHPGYKVGSCGEQFCEQVHNVVKDTSFYPKICPAIGLTKLNLFLRTYFSEYQSKLGPFAESSDEGLSDHQFQNLSLFKK